MRKFICIQQEEVCKAIVNLGQYSLRNEYQHFSIVPSRLFTSLSDEQKKSARSKFQHASVEDKQEFGNSSTREDDEHFPNPDPPSPATRPNTDLHSTDKELSVDIQKASSITGLPTLIIRQMLSKAADLLSSSNQITPAPGCSEMGCMVASSSHLRPHFVKYTKDGRFECDENCPAFVQRYICSHCVAAAESHNLLQNFLENYCKYAKTPKGSRSVTPNFTRLSMVNLPHRTAGRKGGKAPKKKATARRKTAPAEQRQPLVLGTSSPSHQCEHIVTRKYNNCYFICQPSNDYHHIFW